MDVVRCDRLPASITWVAACEAQGGNLRKELSSLARPGAYDASMSAPASADGDNFICRHCATQYVVSYTKLPIADSGSVYCNVCRRQMIQWNSSQEPSYKLVKRPDQK